MPTRALKPCNHPSCPELTGSRYCAQHTLRHHDQVLQQRRAEGKVWSHDGKNSNERGLGYEWQKFRRWILRRDRFICQECLRQGRPVPATCVDHIIPRSQGGQMTDKNCESLCDACHSAKTLREARQGRNNRNKTIPKGNQR